MNTIEIGPVKRNTPSAWNELSRKQLLCVARGFLTRMSMADFKAKTIISFLHLKNKYLRMVDGESAYALGETLNFLLESNKLTRNMIQRIYAKHRLSIRCYHGPDDSMMSCSFGEYIKADRKKEDYKTSQDPRDLDEICAILYRPMKPFWFIRRHFTESTDCRRKLIDRTLKRRSAMMSHVDPAIKYAILLFLNGVTESLPDKFPHVFKQKSDQDSEQSLGWAGLIISLADGKTDDVSLQRIMDSNMYNVFLGLEHNALEYYKFKKKYNLKDDE